MKIEIVVIMILIVAVVLVLALTGFLKKKQCSVTTLNPEYIDSCCVKLEGLKGEVNFTFTIVVGDNESDWELFVSPDNRIPSYIASGGVFFPTVMCPFDFNASEITGMTFGEQRINFTKCQSIPTTKQVVQDCERRIGE